MSYRRRVRDDLVDVVFDVIRTASAASAPPPRDEAALKAQAEREAARQAARAEKQRRREEASFRQFAGVGAGLLAGGLAAGVMVTPAAVGLGLLVGGLTTVAIRAIQTGAWRPRGPLPGLASRPRQIDPPEVDGREIPKSQRDVVQTVLDDAAIAMRKLDAAARDLRGRDDAGADLCRRLVSAGERLSDAVADEPVKFPAAQRVFTYYLPKAVMLSETLHAASGENGERHAADARHTLARIELAFEKALLDLSSVDAAEMELEMRLINQALDEDLDKPGSKAP